MEKEIHGGTMMFEGRVVGLADQGDEKVVVVVVKQPKPPEPMLAKRNWVGSEEEYEMAQAAHDRENIAYGTMLRRYELIHCGPVRLEQSQEFASKTQEDYEEEEKKGGQK
jgi:hypothetical protein